MKVLLIAGHGAGDPGAVAGGLTEATETRLMANALGTALQKRGVTVGYYPMDRNAYADCGKGVFRATGKPESYDYVLELHFNAVKPDPGDGATKGVECYVTTSEKGVGVEDAMCEGLASLGLTNRRVKRKNFTVIQACKTAGVSSALLEICFLDDADDRRIYTADKQRVAAAIADGLCRGFGIRVKEVDALAENAPSPWAEAACKWAVEQGLFKGDDKGDLRWQEPVTREQMAVLLRRALEK